MTEVAIVCQKPRRCGFQATKSNWDMETAGPSGSTAGRAVRPGSRHARQSAQSDVIETNRAELSAISVAIEGLATYGVLARPARDFLDVFQV